MKTGTYNRETKDLAKSLYLRGDSLREIARAVGCSHMAVSRWCQEENWAEYRDRIYAENAQVVAEKAKEILSGIQVESLTAYRKVMQKGLEELPKSRVGTAKEAVYLIETGINGLKKEEQATLPIQFIAEVADIIKTEVADKETVNRIALRFRELFVQHSGAHSSKPTEVNNPEARN